MKGKAACELKRELGVDYKTAFVLLHKLREAVAALRVAVKLDGIVEMDGMYVGGHVRPKNEKAKRVDRRLAENRTGKRMAVMVLRQRAADNMTLVLRAGRSDFRFRVSLCRHSWPTIVMVDRCGATYSRVKQHAVVAGRSLTPCRDWLEPACPYYLPPRSS